MNDHEKIRALLALAAADVLEPGEEKQLMDHLRTCDACGAELEKWKLLAGGLRRLPTPQPRSLWWSARERKRRFAWPRKSSTGGIAAVIIGLLVSRGF